MLIILDCLNIIHYLSLIIINLKKNEIEFGTHFLIDFVTLIIWFAFATIWMVFEFFNL